MFTHRKSRLRVGVLVAVAAIGGLSACEPVPTPAPVTPAPLPATVAVWRTNPLLGVGPSSQFSYGGPADTQFLACDFAGRDVDSPVVYRDGRWFQRDDLSSGSSSMQFNFGDTQGTALCGDWDGNGQDSVAVFRNGVWTARNSATAGAPNLSLNFGSAGDTPLVGDWDGDGVDSPGVFRDGKFTIRSDWGAVSATSSFSYGGAGAKPVVGDWNGDGVDGTGVKSGATWQLRQTATPGSAQISFPYGDDSKYRPIVGAWTRGGADRPGVVRQEAASSRNATGNVSNVSFEGGSAVVTGSASDVDARTVTVRGRVDGKQLSTASTATDGMYVLRLPVTSASRQVCVEAVNFAAGSAAVTQLGCRLVGAPAAGNYRFLFADGRGRPGRWNPCAPVHYVVNKTGIPAGREGDIHAAFKTVSTVTGIPVVFDGYTNESASTTRPLYDKARYGDRYSPVLVAYPYASTMPWFNGGAVGVAAPAAYNLPEGMVIVGGTVFVNRTAMESGPWPAGTSAGNSHGKLLLHEVGHLFGMQHFNSQTELMNPIIIGRSGGFGAGDKAGLGFVGKSQGCLPVTPVAWVSGARAGVSQRSAAGGSTGSAPELIIKVENDLVAAGSAPIAHDDHDGHEGD